MNFLNNLTSLFNKKQEQKQNGYIPSNLNQANRVVVYVNPNREAISPQEALRKARIYADSNPTVEAYINATANAVIGSGIIFESKVPDLVKKKSLENYWYDFTKAKNFDLAGKKNDRNFSTTGVKRHLVDGEKIVRIVKGTGKYGLKLQLLDYTCIDFQYNATNVINGVEFDGFGQITRYFLKHYDGSTFPIPAEEIIIIKNEDIKGSMRGITKLLPVMHILDDIDLICQKVNETVIKEATNAIVYKSSNGRASYQGAQPTVSDMMSINPNAQAQEQPITVDEKIYTAYQTGKITPGKQSIEALPSDVDLEFKGSNYPQSSLVPHLQLLFNLVASGLHMSWMTLARDSKAGNYSSSQFVREREVEDFKALRAEVIEQFYDVVFELWLTELLRTHKDEFPMIDGSYQPYFEHTFYGPGFAPVDKPKQRKSDIDALQNGLITLREYCSSNGYDEDDYLDTMEASIKKIQDRNLMSIFFPNTIKQQTPDNTENLNKQDLNDTQDDEITVING